MKSIKFSAVVWTIVTPAKVNFVSMVHIALLVSEMAAGKTNSFCR
jgi:hypothetical protein